MTDDATTEELLAQLRAADPVPQPADPTRQGAAPSAAHAASLFEEITMSDPTLSDPTLTDPTTNATSADDLRDFGPAPQRDELAPKRTGRRLAWTGVAAATAAVVGFGAVSLGPGSTSEVQAAMISAAENTEAARAGTAIITVSSDLGDRAPMGANLDELVLTTAFDGSDLMASLDTADLGMPIGGSPEVRIVDGVIYLSLGDSTWYSVEDARIVDLLTTAGLPVDIRNDLSQGIVELVKSAENVEEIEPGHFRATVTVEEARRLAEDFPSLGLYTDRALTETDELPAEIAEQPLEIDLVLDSEGLIDVVTIGATLDDPDSTESLRGSIRIDMNDLGTAQAIEAPADAEPIDLGSFLGED